MVQAGAKKSTIPKVNSKAGINSLIIFVVLLLAWIAGFSSRLFAVIRFESIIHEFDPWFNYRATAYMVKHGFYNFLNWFDERAWYPLGRIVGGTVYPGLMLTSGSIHYLLHLLHINVHIRDICVFLAPVFRNSLKNKHRLIFSGYSNNDALRQANDLRLPVPALTLVKDSLYYNGLEMFNHFPGHIKF